MHYWSRVTKERRAVAGTAHTMYISLLCQLDTTVRLRPLRHLHGSHDRLRRKLHCSNGRLADGTNKTPLGERVYRTRKRIREEIPNHCSTINIFPVYYTSLLSPPVGVRRLCTHPPCTIKGGHPLEKDSSPAGQRIDSFILRAIHHTVDVGYYAPAARTTLNPCVLAFLPPS